MFLRDVVIGLARRWYLTLAGLLVTAGLALVALQLVPPAWETKASVVLLPPKSAVEPGGNPYLQLGGLAPTLDLLVASLGDQRMQQSIKAVSPSAEYTVEADTSSSGPVMVVSVHDKTPANSLAVRDELVRVTSLRLAELQDNLTIPARSRITSMVVTQDAEPRVVGKDQLRAVVVAVGAGIVGTAFLIAVVDGHLVRRRLARAGTVSESEEVSAEWPSEEAVPDSQPRRLVNAADKRAEVSVDNQAEVSADKRAEVSADNQAEVSADKRAEVSADKQAEVSADKVSEVWPLWPSPHSDPIAHSDLREPNSNLREPTDRDAKSQNGEIRYFPTPDSLTSDRGDEVDTPTEFRRRHR